MMVSLRNRLLVGMVTGLTLLLACSGVLVYWAMRKGLYDQCDAAIAATAQILSTSIEERNGQLKFELDAAIMTRFQKGERPDYYLVEMPNNGGTCRSPSLDLDTAEYLQAKVRSQGYRTTYLPNSQVVRTLRTSVMPRVSTMDSEKSQASAQPAVLIVARDITEMKSHTDSLQWLLIVSGALTVALSVAVGVTVVDRGLRPMTMLAGKIDGISDQSLQTRLDSKGVPPELLPVVNQLNHMLARLDESFIRQRRFNADVAHELRTPLSGLSTTLEVALLKTREAKEYRDTISTCLPIVRSMQLMVTNLLELTRPDNIQKMRMERVNLAEVIDTCWQPLAERASQLVLSFENNVPLHVEVQTDRGRLAMIVSNVLDNAVEYCTPGGHIRAEASRSEDKVTFSLYNTTSGLSQQDATQVFDCFWRGDQARSNTGVHCGLGLAIVKKLTESMGGSVRAQVKPEGLFEITLVMNGTNTEGQVA